MNNKNRLFRHYISIVVILLVASVFVTWQITYNHVSKDMNEKFTQMIISETSNNDISRMMYNVDSVIRNMYNGEVNDKELIDKTITGYVYGLGDKYASYMNAEEYERYLEETKKDTKVGIGVTAVFDADAGGLYVLSVYDGTPAAKSGIIPGDVITKIDGKTVTEVGFSMALDSIGSGAPGSVVNISVRSDFGGERLAIMERQEISIETVTYRIIERDIGLIKISEFNKSTPEEFKNAIQELTRKGAYKFIFDVRNNPGGDLDSIVEILDFLLPSGNILTIIENNGTQRKIISDASEFSVPMAVLVNTNTASAAELFVAALQDYDKAEIVGDKTYGKGTVQEIVKLPNGGAASISVSTYLPPNGVSYDGIGVRPDIEISLPLSTLEKYYKMSDSEDLQLQSAIEIVKNKENEVFQ